MALVSVTRLRIRSYRFLVPFLWESMCSALQVRSSEGFRCGKIMRNRQNVFWTMTVWRDLPAMNAFRGAGPHGRVMRRLLEWCDEATSVHWEQQSEELCGWQEAHQRMQSDGRVSKVNHPSPRHSTLRFSAPEPRRAEAPIGRATKK